MKTRPVIGLTMGDPAGVGPELCLRTLANLELRRTCDLVVFGSFDILQRVSRQAGVPMPVDLRVLKGLPADDPGAGIVIVDGGAPEATAIVPGKVSADCGAAAFEFIQTAIHAAQAEQLDAVVTAPIHKEALRLAGVAHPGHTEIFTALTGAKRTCMMLRSEVLTVSMVTTHIGYAEVPQRLNVSRLLDVTELTAVALERMIGRQPRLAICGLNPHAGEHGLFGQREEERFVVPAVQQARARGFDLTGPLPPDTAFTADNRQRFDGVVCLYHDQGHIPFKMLAFDDGVNITLGLPIVRTSVDHGTAFDIAWKGVARPSSLFKAVECAIRLSRNRLAQ